MIKITVSILFTIYSLSSSSSMNRRLLQIPGGNAAEPVVIEPGLPIEAATPTEPATPIEAATPADTGGNTGGNAVETTTQAQPSTAVEPTTPSTTTGGGPNTNTNTNTNANTNTNNGLPWNEPQTSTTTHPLLNIKTECRITPPHEDSCAQRPITIYNPTENWELQANAVGAMYQSEITIDIPPTSTLAEITGFWFTEPYSGAEATITINNPTGRRIGIEAIHSTEAFACQGMTIYTGPNVFVRPGVFWCDPQKEGACDNCWVKKDAADVGLPCTAYA